MAQKAPGKHYREGISLVELFERFPDDAAAERWFEERRWGDGPSYCPMCGGTERLRPNPTRKPLPYWCGECRRHFSVRTGTVMHRSKIGLQKWAIAVYLWTTSLKGVSSMKLHRDLKITQKSAYFMAQRLREAWTEGHGGMAGPVEVDETHIGGKEKTSTATRSCGPVGALWERPRLPVLWIVPRTLSAPRLSRVPMPLRCKVSSLHGRPREPRCTRIRRLATRACRLGTSRSITQSPSTSATKPTPTASSHFGPR